MKKPQLFVLAIASTVFVPALTRAQFADTVVSYTEGVGVYAGYNDPSVALGSPSTQTVDPDPMYGGTFPVDPFGAPYLSSQIVGLGTGGSLTLQFSTPIRHDAAHPYGLDFIIFGHAGFSEDFDTFTATDGSFYTGGTGDVRVSVSMDGLTFYNLIPQYGTAVDGLFPTDGSGNPFLPVNPALTADDFSGLDLDGIRSLYAGSAGGAGYDLNWAVDGDNQSVALSEVNYVRLDNLSGAAYIDAISAVPEPTTVTVALAGAGLLWLCRRRISKGPAV